MREEREGASEREREREIGQAMKANDGIEETRNNGRRPDNLQYGILWKEEESCAQQEETKTTATAARADRILATHPALEACVQSPLLIQIPVEVVGLVE